MSGAARMRGLAARCGRRRPVVARPPHLPVLVRILQVRDVLIALEVVHDLDLALHIVNVLLAAAAGGAEQARVACACVCVWGGGRGYVDWATLAAARLASLPARACSRAATLGPAVPSHAPVPPHPRAHVSLRLAIDLHA